MSPNRKQCERVGANWHRAVGGCTDGTYRGGMDGAGQERESAPEFVTMKQLV
jgi:hypothetical protein